MVYDKSDQHTITYNSYNLELATRKIKSIKLEKASNSDSAFNSIKFDFENKNNQYLLYCQFVAWHWYCGGLSIVPLTNYANNKVYQELPRFEKHVTESDNKVFIDLRRGKGYTSKIEKLARDDSDLTVTVTLKNSCSIENEIKSHRLLSRRIILCVINVQAYNDL